MTPSKAAERAANAVLSHLNSGGNASMVQCIIDREIDPLLKICERLVFAADARLLSEKHRVIEEARAAIKKAI